MGAKIFDIDARKHYVALLNEDLSLFSGRGENFWWTERNLDEEEQAVSDMLSTDKRRKRARADGYRLLQSEQSRELRMQIRDCVRRNRRLWY